MSGPVDTVLDQGSPNLGPKEKPPYEYLYDWGPEDNEEQTAEPFFMQAFAPTSIDVTDSTFTEILPAILATISRSSYVAIDLEMSGIELGGCWKRPATPEEAYKNAKNVAQTYNILQIGLTTMKPDQDRFLCQTYKLHLTPLCVRRGKAATHLSQRINRRITFSTKTLEFLEDHGFRIQDAFCEGVPYMSRVERQEYGRYLAQAVPLRSEPDQGDQGKQDTEMIAFMTRMTKLLEEFAQNPESTGGAKFLNLTNMSSGDLNRHQVKLLHELVENRFPLLTSKTMCSGAFVQVTIKDENEASKVQQQRVRERTQALAEQTGASLIFEALTGGDFAKFFPEIWEPLDPKGLFERVHRMVLESEARLKKRTPVLIAHNCLCDLCFIHQTFFGQLPNSLSEFKKSIHKLFPRILDSKYLFLKGATFTSPDAALETCFRDCRGEYRPSMTWQIPATRRYTSHQLNSSHSHDAGYDSYMTAVVAVKKGYKLAADLDLCLSSTPNPSVIGRRSTSPSNSDSGSMLAQQMNEGDLPPQAQDPFFRINPFREKETERHRMIKKTVKQREKGIQTSSVCNGGQTIGIKGDHDSHANKSLKMRPQAIPFVPGRPWMNGQTKPSDTKEDIPNPNATSSPSLQTRSRALNPAARPFAVRRPHHGTSIYGPCFSPCAVSCFSGLEQHHRALQSYLLYAHGHPTSVLTPTPGSFPGPLISGPVLGSGGLRNQNKKTGYPYCMNIQNLRGFNAIGSCGSDLPASIQSKQSNRHRFSNRLTIPAQHVEPTHAPNATSLPEEEEVTGSNATDPGHLVLPEWGDMFWKEFGNRIPVTRFSTISLDEN